MLTEIHIRNYLFVSDQRLAFGPGMTVLSGETGAGKSILVGAVALIFGDPAPALEPFEPGQPIFLEASFDLAGNREVRDFLSEQGHPPDTELTLAREVSVAGKSTYFLNGRRVAASLLKELKPLMIDFHHQRDQQRLLQASYQLKLLDLHAQNEELAGKFAAQYRELRSNLKQLEALKTQAEQESQLRELYHYQYEELEKAALHAGEDSSLQQEFDLLSHAREIAETAATAAFDLYESETSVHSRLAASLAAIGHFAHLNPRLAAIEQGLRECLELISDNAFALGDLTAELNQDPARLEAISERLDLINSLLHKHMAQNIGELLDLFSRREAQINAYADLSGRIGELEDRIGRDFEALRALGDQLSATRVQAAEKLCDELRASISLLSIPDARFKISIDKKTDGKIIMQEYLDSCTEQGQDDCQFFFSANRGSQLKPLSAVASGGELSRILLAIKKVLSGRIEEKLMILDEIDAGIGGKTAERVAQFIFQLARRHRIICITHLAQIAAMADQQIALQKEPGRHKTVIKMVPLQAEQRLAELARMLAGNISDVSLEHARELITKYKT